MARYAEFEAVSPRGRSLDGGRYLLPGAASVEYEESSVVCRGGYDDVLEFFDAQMWTDGLPIIPPTVGRVEQMLAQTDRDPAEVIGVVGEQATQATVWNTAVNAVMAGCRDIDLPIVLALTEILADPEFRVRDAGSTTSWEILVVLSGPDLPERGFNTETGVMRLGRRANTALGRFTRLWIRNVVGLLTPPGFGDAAAIGQSFHVAMAENEAGSRAAGWSSCREEWGYKPTDLVVAAQGIVAVSAPIYTAGADPGPHLRLLGAAIAGSSAFFGGAGANTGMWSPTLAINPAVAAVFGRAGMSKDDLRAALVGHALAPARVLADGLAGMGGQRLDLAGRVAAGKLPRSFHLSDDIDRLVPVIPDAGRLGIVVTGNPGRNQSKYYVPLGQPGQRRTRRVIVR